MSSLTQRHHILDNLYIHEFKFEDMTKTAVDEFLAELTSIMQRKGHLGAIILDMSTHQPPVRYFTEQFYAWLRRYFLVNSTRLAVIIHRNYSMESTLRLLMQAATAGRNVETELFRHDERDDMLKWLSA